MPRQSTISWQATRWTTRTIQTDRYPVRPFAYVDETSEHLATARAMLNDEGKVVRVLHGLVPLSGERRGEDVMLTDALGFDLRVYDPGAPLFAHADTETVLEPTDPAWTTAYMHADNTAGTSTARLVGTMRRRIRPFRSSARVRMSTSATDSTHGRSATAGSAELPPPQFAPAFSTATVPWFFTARGAERRLRQSIGTGLRGVRHVVVPL